jgi:hypothetical protein
LQLHPFDIHLALMPSPFTNDRINVALISSKPMLSMATLFEIQTSTHVREIIALDCTNSLNELRLKGLKSYFVLAVRCHSHISILSLKFVFGNKKQGVYISTIDTISFKEGDRPANCSWKPNQNSASFVGLLELAIITLSGSVYTWTADFCSTFIETKEEEEEEISKKKKKKKNEEDKEKNGNEEDVRIDNEQYGSDKDPTSDLKNDDESDDDLDQYINPLENDEEDNENIKVLKRKKRMRRKKEELVKQKRQISFRKPHQSLVLVPNSLKFIYQDMNYTSRLSSSQLPCEVVPLLELSSLPSFLQAEFLFSTLRRCGFYSTNSISQKSTIVEELETSTIWTSSVHKLVCNFKQQEKEEKNDDDDNHHQLITLFDTYDFPPSLAWMERIVLDSSEKYIRAAAAASSTSFLTNQLPSLAILAACDIQINEEILTFENKAALTTSQLGLSLQRLVVLISYSKIFIVDLNAPAIPLIQLDNPLNGLAARLLTAAIVSTSLDTDILSSDKERGRGRGREKDDISYTETQTITFHVRIFSANISQCKLCVTDVDITVACAPISRSSVLISKQKSHTSIESLIPLITCSVRIPPRVLPSSLFPPPFITSTSVLNGLTTLYHLYQQTNTNTQTQKQTQKQKQLTLLLSFSNGELVLFNTDSETITNVTKVVLPGTIKRTEIVSATFPFTGAPNDSSKTHYSQQHAIEKPKFEIDVDTIDVPSIDEENKESVDIDRVCSSFFLGLQSQEDNTRNVFISIPRDFLMSAINTEESPVSNDLITLHDMKGTKFDDMQFAEMDRGLEALSAVTFPLVSRREKFLLDSKLSEHVHPISYSDFGAVDGLGVSFLSLSSFNSKEPKEPKEPKEQEEEEEQEEQEEKEEEEKVEETRMSRRRSIRTLLGPQLIGLVGSSSLKGQMKIASELLLDIIDPLLSTSSADIIPAAFRTIDPRSALLAGGLLNASLFKEITLDRPISRSLRITNSSLVRAWKSSVHSHHIDSILKHIDKSKSTSDEEFLIHTKALVGSLDSRKKLSNDKIELPSDESLLFEIQEALTTSSPLTLRELTLVLRLQPNFSKVTYRKILQSIKDSPMCGVRTTRLRCLFPLGAPHTTLHVQTHPHGSNQSEKSQFLNAIRERNDPSVRYVLSTNRTSIIPVERINTSKSIQKNTRGIEDSIWSGVYKSVISKRSIAKKKSRKQLKLFESTVDTDESSDDSIEKKTRGRPKGSRKPNSLLASLFSFEEPSEGTCWIVRTRGDLANAYWKRRGFTHNPFRSKTQKFISERELEFLEYEGEAAVRQGLRFHLGIKAWDEIEYPMPNFQLAPASASIIEESVKEDSMDQTNNGVNINEENKNDDDENENENESVSSILLHDKKEKKTKEKKKKKKKDAKYSIITLGIFMSHYEAVLAASEAYAFGVCAWSFVKDLPPLVFTSAVKRDDDDPVSSYLRKKSGDKKGVKRSLSSSRSIIHQPSHRLEVEGPCSCHLPLSLDGSEYPCDSSACLLPSLLLLSLGIPSTLPSKPLSMSLIPTQHITHEGFISLSSKNNSETFKDPNFILDLEKIEEDKEVEEEEDKEEEEKEEEKNKKSHRKSKGPSFSERFFHKKTPSSRLESTLVGEGLDHDRQRRRNGGDDDDDNDEDEDETGLAAEEEEDRFMALLGIQPMSSSQSSVNMEGGRGERIGGAGGVGVGSSTRRITIQHDEEEEEEEEEEDKKDIKRIKRETLGIWPVSARAFIHGKLSEVELSSNYATALDTNLWINSGKIEKTLRTRGPGTSKKFKGPASVHPDRSGVLSKSFIEELHSKWNTNAQKHHQLSHLEEDDDEEEGGGDQEKKKEQYVDQDNVDEEEEDEDGDRLFSNLSQTTHVTSFSQRQPQLVSSLSSGNRLNRASSSLRVRIMAPS